MTQNIWGLLGPGAREQALYSGLLNLGGGLMAAGAPTTQPGMSARGLVAATQGFNQGINDAQQTGLRSLLVGNQMAEAKLKEAQRAQMEQYIGTLPPEHQGIARAAPEQFFGRMAQTTFPDPTQTRRDLTGDELKMRGLPPGTVAQVDGRGQIHVVNKSDLLTPEAVAQQQQIRAAGRPQVNVNMPQETEEAKVVGRKFGELYSDLQTRDLKIPGEFAQYDRLGNLLQQVNTGKFAGTTQALKAAAKSAGIDLDGLGIKDDVAPAQAAVALSRELALKLRNPEGGAGMPGAMSDADREFLASMVPGIENDPAAIPIMLSWRKKLLEREREIAKQAREYRKTRGRIDEGFFQQIADYGTKNPLFSEKDRPAPSAAPDAANPYSSMTDQQILDNLRKRGLLK